MKTIVINTSRALEQTKLDVLFRAPFDPEELIWHNVRLHQIGTLPHEIYCHFNEEDTYVRGYDLYVIVDLYDFPEGRTTEYDQYYGAFVRKYIEAELLNILKGKYHLLPRNVTVCFSNTKTVEEGFSPTEREEAAKHERKNQLEDRVFEALFGWTSGIKGFDSIGWEMKYSESEDAYLDFSEVLANIKNSKFTVKEGEEAEGIDYYKRLKLDVNEVLNPFFKWFNGNNEKNDDVKITRFIVERNNDTELLTGFFNLLASIFLWTYSAVEIGEIKEYTVEEIKIMLSDCAEKYKLYFDGENMTFEYYSLDSITDRKGSIFSEWKDKWNKSELESKTKSDASTSVVTGNNNVGKTSESDSKGRLDREFYSLLEEISNNYSSGLIKGENEGITNSLVKKVWERRLKIKTKDFLSIINKNKKDGEKKSTRDILVLTDLDKEYSLLVEKITQAESDFLGNDDIVETTRKNAAEYKDLKRKEKWSIIALIGGIVSVFAAVYPYVEIRSNVKLYSHVDWLFILPFVGVVAGVYVFAAMLYLGRILSQKSSIVKNLREMKIQSEQARKKSIEAFKSFCMETLPEAEALMLMKRELERRDEENNKTAIKFSTHKAKFKELFDLVEGYKTKMKIPGKPIGGKTAKKFPTLNVNENFYCEENQLAYSVLDLNKAVSENKKEEESEE